MVCHQLDFRTIDEDFMLGGLESEYIRHILVWYRVEVGIELKKAVDPANPQGHFRRVIMMKGQWLKGILLLFHKQFQRGTTGGVMDMLVRLFPEPPPGGCPQIIQILKYPTIEQILFYIVKRGFYFSLGLGSSRLAANRFTVIMSDKCYKCRVVKGVTCFPAQNYGFFTIV
jgi:hypothetical protein